MFPACCVPDVDECARNNGGCQRDCQNTVGSYKCRCNTGFELAEDMKGCTGTYVCYVYIDLAYVFMELTQCV